MIPWLILTAALSGSVCWCLGHRTARTRVIVIGATAQQDQAAITAADADRFWQVVAGLDLDHPDDPRFRDLRGQGLTAVQLHTITDIEPIGSYL